MEQIVATFYQFVELPDHEDFGERLKKRCEESDVLGTVILATEGINATIAGTKKGIGEVMAFLRTDKRLAQMTQRESVTERLAFHRLRIINRPEIVTLGDPSVNPCEAVGEHVDPKDWNALIRDPEVILIDVRNDYEVEIGTFRGAIDPKTETFGEWGLGPPPIAVVTLPIAGGDVVAAGVAKDMLKGVGFGQLVAAVFDHDD